MQSKKWLGLIALLLIAIVGFFVIKSQKPNTLQPSPASQLTKVKVGIFPTASNLQLFVAQEKGYFKDEDLEVETIPMASGPIIANAVSSGDLQIGWSSAGAIIIAHIKGFDYQFVSAGAYKRTDGSDFQQFLVSSKSDIKTAKDLEGRKFAVNANNELMKLGMNSWAKKNNLDMAKVTVVELPFDQMGPALKNNQIDAGNFNEPYLTKALEDGTGRVLETDPFGATAKSFLFSAWFGSKAWIDKNPQIVSSFQKAIDKATVYINGQPTDLANIISKHAKIDEATAGKMIMPVFKSAISKGDIQEIIDLYEKNGYTKKGFPEQEIVSNVLN